MKILVVCQYYYPEPFRISDICQALAAQGNAVTVVTGTPNYPEGKIYPGYEKGARSDEVIGGVRIHRCPLIARKSGVLFRFLNYYSFVWSSRRYLRQMEEDFDVVFVNQLSPVMMAEGALAWAKRKDRRCVLYCLDLWPESLLAGGIRPNSPVYQLFLRISRRIYRSADEILVSSRGFADYFRERLEIDEKRIRYLPQYAENLFGELPRIPEEKQTVDFLFAGNVGSGQSVETIVEAARLLQDAPNIHIHIVGGGISLEKCRALAEGLPNITFYGRQALEQMPHYYAMADVFLVSLVKDPVLSVCLPGKVQSYLAAGKPIVGSIEGETERVIRDAQCGICAPAEDSRALAQIIRQTADQPEKRKQYGENARRYYREHFQKEKFLADLAAVLRENAPKDVPEASVE